MAVLKIVGVGEIGKYHDAKSFFNVVNYCATPEKTVDRQIGGIGVNPANAIMEMETLYKIYGKPDGKHLRHFILSFEEFIYPHSALYIAYEIAKYYGYQYQIFFAVHQDTKNLHIHFVMSTVNYISFKKYEGGKKDYYDFINYVTQVLRNHDFSLIVQNK